MWPGKHKGAQTAIGPSQSPSRSLETARPVGRASNLDSCPWAKVPGSETDLLTPGTTGGSDSLSHTLLLARAPLLLATLLSQTSLFPRVH